MSTNTRQTLNEIFDHYYEKTYGHTADGADAKGCPCSRETFYKNSKEKLQRILEAFDIKLTDFMEKKKFYFNDSKNEIITMLECFNNKIVKNIRLNKMVDFSVLLFDKDIEETLTGAYEFGNALNKFMEKNTYTPPQIQYKLISTSDYDKNEYYDEIYGNLIEQIKFLSNDAKFAPYMNRHIVDIILLLQDILAYTLESSTDESIDVLDKTIVEDGLETLIKDLSVVRDKYKMFFDIIYNGDFDKYPNFRYTPFPEIQDSK